MIYQPHQPALFCSQLQHLAFVVFDAPWRKSLLFLRICCRQSSICCSSATPYITICYLLVLPLTNSKQNNLQELPSALVFVNGFQTGMFIKHCWFLFTRCQMFIELIEGVICNRWIFSIGFVGELFKLTNQILVQPLEQGFTKESVVFDSLQTSSMCHMTNAFWWLRMEFYYHPRAPKM